MNWLSQPNVSVFTHHQTPRIQTPRIQAAFSDRHCLPPKCLGGAQWGGSARFWREHRLVRSHPREAGSTRPARQGTTAKVSSERTSQDRAAVLFPTDSVILVQEKRIMGNSETVPGTEILNTYKLTRLGRHWSGPGQIAFIEWSIVKGSTYCSENSIETHQRQHFPRASAPAKAVPLSQHLHLYRHGDLVTEFPFLLSLPGTTRWTISPTSSTATMTTTGISPASPDSIHSAPSFLWPNAFNFMTVHKPLKMFLKHRKKSLKASNNPDTSWVVLKTNYCGPLKRWNCISLPFCQKHSMLNINIDGLP